MTVSSKMSSRETSAGDSTSFFHPLLKLGAARAAWSTAGFANALKSEMENLGARSLPLDQFLLQGGYVADNDICVMVLGSSDRGREVEAKIGVFFTELVGCCGCPIEPFEESVYCELVVTINKSTGEAGFRRADSRD